MSLFRLVNHYNNFVGHFLDMLGGRVFRPLRAGIFAYVRQEKAKAEFEQIAKEVLAMV